MMSDISKLPLEWWKDNASKDDGSNCLAGSELAAPTLFCRIVHESLLRRSEHWRTSQNDSHGFNTAVYVALVEVANAINDASIFAAQRQNEKGQR